MKYENYLIKKGKLDLLSSLKALDKKLLNEKIKEFGVKNIYELKDYILADFEFCLKDSIDDIFTIRYFERLMNNENSKIMSAYEEDIESLFVFVYNNGNYYSYYIPTEIKEIINKLIVDMTPEEKFNLTNATDRPINKNLKEIISTLKVNDLRSIGELLRVDRLSKKKKELIEIVYNALTDKNKLTDLIERFIDKEFNLLKDLIKNKGTIQNNNISVQAYHFLHATGLVFIFRRENKFYISMTDDVYNVIKKIDLKQIEKIVDENTKVYNLVRSMVELYGIVSYSSLNYYYSLYYGNELEAPNNALLFCERDDNIDIINTEYDTYFIHIVLRYKDFDQELDDIISGQQSIKRKPIKLEELLKYSNYDYYEETEAKNKFKKYLEKKNIPSNTIEDIIKEISDIYRLGYTFIETSLIMIQDYGVELTEKNSQEILNYLIEIYNNSRIWSNNGWTPIEMRKEYK